MVSALFKALTIDGRGDKIRTCDFYVPNVALYQAEPHLDGVFLGFSVSGQTCGQTTYIGNFIRLGTAKICSVFKGFQRFWNFYARKR